MNEKINAYFMVMENDAKKGVSYTNGQLKACMAWENSKRFNSNELECDSLPWEQDMPDFLKTLREAGAETLAVTETSSGLMHGIHNLVNLGCTMEGVCIVKHFNGVMPSRGIRFRLN